MSVASMVVENEVFLTQLSLKHFLSALPGSTLWKQQMVLETKPILSDYSVALNTASLRHLTVWTQSSVCLFESVSWQCATFHISLS